MPDEVLRDLLREVVGSNNFRLQRVPNGQTTETYRIYTGNPERILAYLRINNVRKNRREVALLHALTEQGRRVPQLLKAGSVEVDNVQRHYSVICPIEGKELDKANLSRKAMKRALEEIGREVARIHFTAIPLNCGLSTTDWEDMIERSDSTESLYARLDTMLRNHEMSDRQFNELWNLDMFVDDIVFHYQTKRCNGDLVVVHRDIKPEHCMVDHTGKLLGIIDWGAAGTGLAGQDFAPWSIRYADPFDLSVIFNAYCDERGNLDSAFSREECVQEFMTYLPVELFKEIFRHVSHGKTGLANAMACKQRLRELRGNSQSTSASQLTHQVLSL